MMQRVAKRWPAFAVVLFCSAASAQTTFNFSNTCAQATVGPLTIFGDSVPNTGSVILTPNVLATGLGIVSEGASHRTDSYPTSGNFSGTRSCTLTFGGINVNYTMPLSLSVAPNPGPSAQNCTPAGFAGSCLTKGPASVTVNLGAQGTVVISAPAVVSDGFDTSEVTIGFITVVPGSAVDTALLTPATPPPVPLPPSFALILTGLAGAGLYQVRRKFARAN
jgi:hypothetical protein